MIFDPEVDQIIDRLKAKDCPESIIVGLQEWNGEYTYIPQWKIEEYAKEIKKVKVK